MSAGSLTARRCSNCHAPSARLDAETCEYCGTAIPRPAGEPVRPSHLDEVAARFARGVLGASKSARLAHAPVERRKALVVNERTSIHGDGRRDVETRYHATLEFPDGSRREHSVIEDAAGSITPGDIGVAYLRGERVVAFTRVRV